ncbi:MAG: hypothetical protein ACLQLG_19095 [Thermoguttaceae bacterium]
MKLSLSVPEGTQGPRIGTVGAARQDTLVLSLAMDLDSDLGEKWFEFPHKFDQERLPSALLIKAHVYTTQPRKKMGSANYLATVRRREAGSAAKIVRNLASRATDDHFIVWTEEALESLRRSVGVLADAEESAYPEHEGNACEVLREVRDSFLNGGWQKYREPGVAEAVAGILGKLAQADEVVADDVDAAMATLFDLGLEPGAGLACFNEEEEVSD